MSLVDRLRSVNDRLQTLNSRFGDPRYIKVAVLNPDGVFTLLEPNPKVTEVNPRLIAQWLAVGVEIALDDRLIAGVSRSVAYDTVAKSKYFLNAQETTPGVYTGQKAEVISVSTTDMLTYDVIVRRYRSR